MHSNTLKVKSSYCKKWWLLIAVFTVFSSYALSQPLSSECIPTLSFSYIRTVSPSLDISPDYNNFDYGIISKRAISMEIRLVCNYPLPRNPSIELSGTLAAGQSPYKIVLVAGKSFSSVGPNGINAVVPGLNLTYFSLLFGARYTTLITAASQLSFFANIGAVYFPPEYQLIYWGDLDGNHVYKTLFESQLSVNEQNRILFIPNIGMVYSHKIGERFNFEISASGVYSGKDIMFTDPNYIIMGDHDTLTGTFKKQFKYLGIGLGISYNLK